MIPASAPPIAMPAIAPPLRDLPVFAATAPGRPVGPGELEVGDSEEVVDVLMLEPDSTPVGVSVGCGLEDDDVGVVVLERVDRAVLLLLLLLLSPRQLLSGPAWTVTGTNWTVMGVESLRTTPNSVPPVRLTGHCRDCSPIPLIVCKTSPSWESPVTAVILRV